MLCYGTFASASAFAPRSAPEVNEKFVLYAYGESVGGLSIFYADGKYYFIKSCVWVQN